MVIANSARESVRMRRMLILPPLFEFRCNTLAQSSADDALRAGQILAEIAERNRVRRLQGIRGLFNYEAASDKFTVDPSPSDCGHACHVAVKAKDHIFHPYQNRRTARAPEIKYSAQHYRPSPR